MQLKIGYPFQCPPRATPWVNIQTKMSPCKGKSFDYVKLLPLQGDVVIIIITQGAALG